HPAELGRWGPNPGIPHLRRQYPPVAQELGQSGMRYNDGLPMSRPTLAASSTKPSWPAQYFNIDTNNGWTWERTNEIKDPTLLARLSSSGKENMADPGPNA